MREMRVTRIESPVDVTYEVEKECKEKFEPPEEECGKELLGGLGPVGGPTGPIDGPIGACLIG